MTRWDLSFVDLSVAVGFRGVPGMIPGDIQRHDLFERRTLLAGSTQGLSAPDKVTYISRLPL